MKTNEAGIELIKAFEQLRLDPYLDAVGVSTIGYGAIWGVDGRRVTMAHPRVTEAQAEALLIRDLGLSERSVTRLVTVPLNGNQFSALVSFVFNLGGGSLQASTLRSRLNRGDYADAADEFKKWVRAGGLILKGLVRRRAAERALFLG